MGRTRLEWAQWMTEKRILAFIVEAEKKRPLGGNSWYARSSTDPDQIAEWFDMTPDCNYGLHLGEQYVVIDLDRKENANGIEQFDAICKANGVNNWLFDIETLMVETPGGGYHLYFKTPWPCANRNKFENGIDVRGAIGYVVGPGCATNKKHDGCSTGEYSVMDESVAIADCPDFLLDYMVEPTMKDPERHVPMVEWDLSRNIEHAREWVHTAKPAVEGDNGDNHTYEICCKLRDFGVSEEEAFLLLTDESEGESWNQRCDPSWPDSSLRVKLTNSYKFAQNRPGVYAISLTEDHLKACWPEGGFGLTKEKIAEMFHPPKPLLRVVGEEDDPEIPVGIIGDHQDPNPEPESFVTIERLWYGYEDFIAIDKVREYVIKDWLIAHGITALLAKRGTGKSTIALDLGSHIALDKPWQGIPIMEGWKVIYICGEDDEGMILNARAWAQHYGETPSNTRFMFAKDIIKMTSRSVLKLRLEEMKAWAKGSRCIIILDTWARATTGYNTNAQEEMDQAFTNAEDVAAALNGPMIACFHPPKNARDLTIRGSAVQEDASSGIWWLEEADGAIRLSVGRAKGKGYGQYRRFKFKKVFLDGEDYYGDSLEGIIPICIGGISDEDKRASRTEYENLRQAWAGVVQGCETFSMENNKYSIKTELNRKQIGDMVYEIWNDRGIEPDADNFVDRYMGKLIKLKAAGLGTSSGVVQDQISKFLNENRTPVILDDGTEVKATGASNRPVFVVTRGIQPVDNEKED